MRVHISLDVRDLQASVRFYRQLFAAAPQKEAEDYAKFDLVEPPLNLSLVKSNERVSRVNHFGIEMASSDLVAQWQRRFQEQGLEHEAEWNVDCCFATQDKIWVTDPDGRKWEAFSVLKQLPVEKSIGEGGCCATTCCAEMTGPSVEQHDIYDADTAGGTHDSRG